jgi:hypothetical protein
VFSILFIRYPLLHWNKLMSSRQTLKQNGLNNTKSKHALKGEVVVPPGRNELQALKDIGSEIAERKPSRLVAHACNPSYSRGRDQED